jgi:hypothetical protein
MSKRILFSVFAAVLFWSTVIVFAQEQAAAPVHKDGDTWQFSVTQKGQQQISTSERITGIYELALSQDQVKVYEVNGSQKTEMDINPDGPGGGLLAQIGKNENRPSLKFPLSVGQKWTYEYEIRPAGARVLQKRSAEVNVTGIEQVITPGGSFRAYKLVRNEEWQGGGKQVVWIRNTVTYFYSPETRSVVKSSTANEISSATAETVLIKFTPGN